VETGDIFLSGVGAVVPPTVTTAEAVAAGWYPQSEVDLHDLGGAAVAGAVPAPELALRAARAAVARSGRAPTELDLLLYTSTWHQGPEGWPPQAYLQRNLVGDGVLAVHLRQGCNGMFAAMELAASYLRSVPGRRAALLVAADNFGTPIADRWRMLPGAIAGDAGSALVLDKEQGFARLLSVCTVSISAAEEMHRIAEPLFPPGITEGRILNFGAHNDTFRRNAVSDGAGTAVFVTMKQRLVELIERTTSEAGIKLADLARVTFMNCGRDAAEQLCEVDLELPLEKSTWAYGRTIGHCGASDQTIGFERLMRRGELGPGDHLLMLAYGPGAVISAAVLQVVDKPLWVRA
jgi:3-oxoacyl-[acyl-carrier-protein] synthase-3